MTGRPTITREIPPLPERMTDTHKGEVGRIAVIGGCAGPITMMGAVSLAANAAYRGGAGLVQMIVPKAIAHSVGVLAPCATTTILTDDPADLLKRLEDFRADVLALGPGLGDSISAGTCEVILNDFGGAIVVDADALNLLASAAPKQLPNASRIVLTPHVGEMRRLLDGYGVRAKLDARGDDGARTDASLALVEATGCVVLLKGHRTVVTNGDRLYTNETGNAGMASGGAGDVLTGVVAALIGQKMEPFEASILAAYLHGLAGDFAAEELGRLSVTALDLIEYLPEAFCEYEISLSE